MRVAQLTISCKQEIRQRLDAIVHSQYTSFGTVSQVVTECLLHHLPTIEAELRDVERQSR
jgi:hypothetical protein